MKVITYQQYVEYLKNNTTMKLKEKETTYKISRTGKNNIYNEKKIQEVDKRHDKMLRNILSRKKEMVNFLNQFLNLREKIEEKQSLFASIMIMEKCKKTEELIIQINKIIEMIKEPKDREALAEIIVNVITFRIGKEKANEMLKKINESEETGMSPLTKMLLDLEYKNWKKGVREGEAKGEVKGEGKRHYESSKKYVTIWRIRRKNYEIYRY